MFDHRRVFPSLSPSRNGYESKPWYPDGTLSWFMDVYSPKHGNTIGFDPSPYQDKPLDLHTSTPCHIWRSPGPSRWRWPVDPFPQKMAASDSPKEILIKSNSKWYFFAQPKCWAKKLPIGSMYGIYANIYHQYTQMLAYLPYMEHMGYRLLLLWRLFLTSFLAVLWPASRVIESWQQDQIGHQIPSLGKNNGKSSNYINGLFSIQFDYRRYSLEHPVYLFRN